MNIEFDQANPAAADAALALLMPVRGLKATAKFRLALHAGLLKPSLRSFEF